jgi:hypothetical protein
MWMGYDGVGHEGRVAGLEQHPHHVREALLGADGGDDLGVGVQLDVELPVVERRHRGPQLGDAAARRVPVVPGVVTASASLSTAASGDGMSGFPNARSITSSPARRAAIFKASISART